MCQWTHLTIQTRAPPTGCYADTRASFLDNGRVHGAAAQGDRRGPGTWHPVASARHTPNAARANHTHRFRIQNNRVGSAVGTSQAASACWTNARVLANACRVGFVQFRGEARPGAAQGTNGQWQVIEDWFIVTAHD